jgi:SNF2 family DNA or RNA helicase
MIVIHAHWQLPRALDQAGVLFWAEVSAGQPLTWKRTSLSKNPRPKAHPFCASISELRHWIEEGIEHSCVLCLPTTRTGPLPSPGLPHAWTLDGETTPILAPWIVTGVRLPLAEASLALLEIPSILQVDGSEVKLGQDFLFWSRVSALALECLAAHKVFPLIVPVDPEETTFHARWLPVLDSGKDNTRLAQLEAAMPPVCRAEVFKESEESQSRSPSYLLNNYINFSCDALMRRWGAAAARFSGLDDIPVKRWLFALFSENAVIQASPAQLKWLASSQRAWMRNLHIAGDAAFQIAFRLDAPQVGSDSHWELHYLLQARDDPSLLIPAQEVWKKTESVVHRLEHRFKQPQEKLLAGLGYAGRLFPPIRASLQGKRPTHVQLDTQAAYIFLRETAPLLEGAGFGLLVPPWWNQRGARLGLRMKMRSKEKQEANAVGRMSMEKLIEYRWEVSVGETALTEEEFMALAALKSPLVQIRGQWVTLDPQQVETAIQFWEKQRAAGEIGLLDALQYSLGGENTASGLPLESVTAEGWLADWLERFSVSRQMSQLPQPVGLHGQLRPYQQYGYSWLSFFRQWGLGACLADDMGLGKTIQTIALLQHEKELQGPFPAPVLLVAPTSVVTNWQREFARFAPDLNVYIHRGAERLKDNAFQGEIQDKDVVLTSYPVIRRDGEMFQDMPWQAVILDEAQNIKNPSTKQTQAIRKLKAEYRIALTGTPVENRLSELWSIMHFLNPGYLGSREHFRSKFALPIERYQDKEALQQMRQLVNPFILRRVKTDPSVISDLPEKVETKVYCTLTEEQATLYEAVVQDSIRKIEEQEEGVGRRGLVLSMLMQLKQICNHPVQYLHASSQRGNDPSLNSEMPGRSGKLERLTELLQEILATNDRVLIFTQFAEMGQLLSNILPALVGASTQFLHGGTSTKARDRMIQSFQEDKYAPPIFILSLKAGGTGLNLTRASHVFHFDRWWNPAVEDQATDRAFRIGQKRNVQVHKFVTTGTLEEMIDDMIESKKELAQSVIGSGEQWLTELSTDDLRELVALRRS